MQILARNFQILPLSEIKPYERNSRKHSARQIEKIASSIAEYGFNAPILIDGDNTIVAGHGRFSAAQRLGLTEVPVIQLGHLTDAKRRAYIIADNRLAEDAGWDLTKLAAEVQALQVEGEDLLAIGLDDVDMSRIDIELRRMAADLEMIEAPRHQPAAPPQPQPPSHQPVVQHGPTEQHEPTPAHQAPGGGEFQHAQRQAYAPINSPQAMVPFNVLMTPERRDMVLRVLNSTKQQNGLSTLGDALAFVCDALDGSD
jgi:hypothetical protein